MYTQVLQGDLHDLAVGVEQSLESLEHATHKQVCGLEAAFARLRAAMHPEVRPRSTPPSLCACSRQKTPACLPACLHACNARLTLAHLKGPMHPEVRLKDSNQKSEVRLKEPNQKPEVRLKAECEAEVEAFKATYKAECEALKAQVEAAVRRHIRLTYKAEYVRIIMKSMERAYGY